jgi:hypothetical protein
VVSSLIANWTTFSVSRIWSRPSSAMVGAAGTSATNWPASFVSRSFGRLAGYEDANDAERLSHDLVMRKIFGRDGRKRAAASSIGMGRFEAEWLATEAKLKALADLCGAWIERVHALASRRSPGQPRPQYGNN